VLIFILLLISFEQVDVFGAGSFYQPLPVAAFDTCLKGISSFIFFGSNGISIVIIRGLHEPVSYGYFNVIPGLAS